MKHNVDSILKFIRDKSERPMKMKELGQALNISKREYPNFRNQVKQLILDGHLVKLKRGRIGVPDQMNIAVGEISITRGGLGFVTIEGEDRDIMIPTTGLETALDGDKVMIRLGGISSGRKTGNVIEIVERKERNIVGVYDESRAFCFVHPDNKKIHRDIYIDPESTLGAEKGEKVVVRLTSWNDPHLNPEGEVVERLGMPNAPGVDMLTIIRSYSLPQEFPNEVLDEVESVAMVPELSELSDYEDHTDRCVYTIDPADAKDFDDAVSVKKLSTGYLLTVYIADVSYYVREGSLLDVEAFRRGNSVYLPGTVIPMLPESLSNDVCSLNPNRKRLSFAAEIELDRQGKIVKWRLFNAMIKSKARLAYEEVQAYFDGDHSNQRVKRVADNLVLARDLAQLLSKRRFSEGSLDFDLPESKIILNKNGEVIELGNRVRLEVHRLVEEFMLTANQVVALEALRKGQQFIYRVHDRPNMEKLESFSQLMRQLGYNFPVSPQMKPKQFADFLNQIKDAHEADFINELLLRSMQKAVYQRQNIGHFGLAFKHYTHFTSPIRRYPDLLVHRMLRALRTGQYPPALAKKLPGIIDNVGRHCSDTERVAEAAEREAVKVKQVSYMTRHVGDEFGGVVSGVTGFGFFVRLDNLGAEGLVRISAVDDDYYLFDEKRYQLTGRSSGRSFRLGDKVKVIIVSVDKALNEITLEPVRKKKAIKAGRTKTKSKTKTKQEAEPKPPGFGRPKKKTRRKQR
ncbi:MAG: ribonuclease R [bacterium]|nr:ribonuclease R [bacterium]